LRVLCPVHALLPIDALYVGQYYSYRKSIGASHATLHEDPKFPAQPLSLSACGGGLGQEVHSHLEMLTEENLRAGMLPNEAQRAARVELGGIEQVKEQVREERIGNWLHSVLSDCRLAFRQLRKSPAFTAVAILTVALGVGALGGSSAPETTQAILLQ